MTSGGAESVEVQRPICLLAWNILHGGGARRMPEITLALLDHQPDIVVLTEFRTTTGGQIAGVLADSGLKHQLTTRCGPGINGVCIASRWPIEIMEEPAAPDAHKWLACRLLESGVIIAGVHIPDARSDPARTRYWRDLVTVATRWAKDPSCSRALIVGDFNSGRHGLDEPGRTFAHTSRLGELATLGYKDAYRDLNPESRDYSWFSRSGNGFRLDSAWVSDALFRHVREVQYSQIEREKRVSDHAMLKIHVDFAGFLCAPQPETARRGTP